MNRPSSVAVALIVGFFWIHGPILLFFVGPLYVLELYRESFVVAGRLVALIFACLAIGFVLGWIWWKLTVPMWRVWAAERVSDIPRLRRWAVAAGLYWPDYCLIAMTEAPPEVTCPGERPGQVRG
jgi:hypothetical protein